MGETTRISWADSTWNPIVGCSKCSPGCQHCYAETMAVRLAGMGTRGYGDVVTDGRWSGKTAFVDSELQKPLHWKKPRVVFVCSMGDLFHESVPFEWIDRIYAVMALCPQHEFRVLTKRVGRMREYAAHPGTPLNINKGIGGTIYEEPLRFEWPLPNVMHMVTACNQAEADEKIRVLLQVPSAKRGVSIEPMLGAVDLTMVKWARISVNKSDYTRHGVPAPSEMWSCNNVLVSRPADALNKEKVGLDYVIVGGESGHGARPMHPDWARGVRDQCKAAGVEFHFKQWGEWIPQGQCMDCKPFEGSRLHKWPDGTFSDHVGKKAAGNLLDGKTHEAAEADA